MWVETHSYKQLNAYSPDKQLVYQVSSTMAMFGMYIWCSISTVKLYNICYGLFCGVVM